MSYDAATRISHPMGAITTNATVTKAIKGPAGKRGRVVAIEAGITTTTTGTPLLQVGVAGTLGKFMVLAVGAQTAPAAVATDVPVLGANGIIAIVDTTDALILTSSGGTAGVVEPVVVIDWF